MAESNYGASELWSGLIRENDGKFGDAGSFEQVRNFISAWDPGTNGLRYARTLLFHVSGTLTTEPLRILDAIGDHRYRPELVVNVGGRRMDFDYLQVALEVAFMGPVLTNASSVLEIGGGYGRTCHGVLRVYPGLTRYTIVDLPPMLEVSKRYLAEVLTAEELAKVAFVVNTDFDQVAGPIDLAINIDSMAEMDESVVRAYLGGLDARARHFYVKNPVGKYSPSAIGATLSPGAERALKTGLLRTPLDIFDDAAIAAQGVEFDRVYAPGADWSLLDSASAQPWTYYRQALFRKA